MFLVQALAALSTTLVNGGNYTRTNNSTGQVGSFILSQNNFNRAFTPITVSDAAKVLPDLRGSGWVQKGSASTNDAVFGLRRWV